MVNALGGLIAFLLVLAVLLVLFLIGRELVCWYWKINESLATLKSIDDSLKRMAPARTEAPALRAVSNDAAGV